MSGSGLKTVTVSSNLRLEHNLSRPLELKQKRNTNKRTISQAELGEMGSDIDQLNLDDMKNIIEKSFSGLFENLDIMLDGILPDEDSEITEEDRKYLESGERKDESKVIEDEIHKCFDEARNIFNELKILPDHFSEIVKKTSSNGSETLKTK